MDHILLCHLEQLTFELYLTSQRVLCGMILFCTNENSADLAGMFEAYLFRTNKAEKIYEPSQTDKSPSFYMLLSACHYWLKCSLYNEPQLKCTDSSKTNTVHRKRQYQFARA